MGEPTDKGRCWGAFSTEYYDRALALLSFASIILTLVTVIYLTATAPTRDSLFRVAGVASAAQVVGGPGETGALYTFQLVFDWNENRVVYVVQKLENTTSDVTGIYIRGPIMPYMDAAPITVALCGAPTTACDVMSMPGVVQGQVVNTIYNGVILTGIDVRPVVESIRAYPMLFYLELLTNGAPVTPGAARGPLFQFSGFP